MFKLKSKLVLLTVVAGTSLVAVDVEARVVGIDRDVQVRLRVGDLALCDREKTSVVRSRFKKKLQKLVSLSHSWYIRKKSSGSLCIPRIRGHDKTASYVEKLKLLNHAFEIKEKKKTRVTPDDDGIRPIS